MRKTVKGLLNKILPLFTAAVLACVCALPVLSPSKDSAFAADNGNGWQVVSGGYDAAHKTSQGISNDQLGSYGFVESTDGSVRVNKTVEPTGVENEFIVRLTVDTCAVSAQQTDYKSFFETAPYQGVVSNNLHGSDLGEVKSSVNGSGITVTADASQGLSKSGFVTVQDPQGRTIAENMKIYWDKGNNVTFFLKLDDSHYVMMGLSVRTDSKNTVRLSEEAYRLINEKITGQVEQGPRPELKFVTDIMGDNIEYLGLVEADAGTASFDDASTLTWKPQYSPSCVTAKEAPDIDADRNAAGAVTKLTITQKTRYYGAASLTYKVRLKTEGLSSSYNPDVVSNSYSTNESARLVYSYSTYNKDSNKFVASPDTTIDFPKPQVKGITYDLRALKWNKDDDEALRDAVFKLTREWVDSNGASHTDVVADDLKSGDDGYVTATGLPWGTYTLEEVAAPSGFVLPQGAVRTFELCYSKNSGNLQLSTISSGANRAMSAIGVDRIENERVKTDVSLLKVDADDNAKVLAGAKFSLYKDNGDGAFSTGSDALVFGDYETDDNGKVSFPQLTAGTYFLKETYTPAGYQLNNEVYRIRVFDVTGQAGGTVGNMIQVGKVNGADMRAPETPNTVTIADKPVPLMPVTAGPGVRTLVAAGVTLLVLGGVWLAAARYREQHKLCSAAHAAQAKHHS